MFEDLHLPDVLFSQFWHSYCRPWQSLWQESILTSISCMIPFYLSARKAISRRVSRGSSSFFYWLWFRRSTGQSSEGSVRSRSHVGANQEETFRRRGQTSSRHLQENPRSQTSKPKVNLELTCSYLVNLSSSSLLRDKSTSIYSTWF